MAAAFGKGSIRQISKKPSSIMPLGFIAALLPKALALAIVTIKASPSQYSNRFQFCNKRVYS